jgi:hypothetical protein
MYYNGVKRCESCGQTYDKGTRNQKQYAASRFCSSECFGKARTEVASKIRAATVKQCRQCGKSYSPRYGQWLAFEDSKYCSPECSKNGQRRSIEAIVTQVRLDPVTGCHVWIGYRNKSNYGLARFQGRRQLVHRIVWEYKYGPVPEALQLDHICRNTSCCNPEHLRAVTAQVNVLASDNLCAQNARKTRCPKCAGEYSVMKDGRRFCRPCFNKNYAEYVRRRRAEDPEFKQRLNQATKKWAEGRYLTDPKFKAMRDANNKKHREKLKKEKEPNATGV